MVFNHGDGLKPRVWTVERRNCISYVHKMLYLGRLLKNSCLPASLYLNDVWISWNHVIAVLRLDKEDNIEEVLFSSLMDGTAAAAMDPLASRAWEVVIVDWYYLNKVCIQCWYYIFPAFRSQSIFFSKRILHKIRRWGRQVSLDATLLTLLQCKSITGVVHSRAFWLSFAFNVFFRRLRSW